MAILTLHRKLLMKVGIPYWLFINGHPVGIMRGKEANMQIPEGTYNIGVKMVFALWKWCFCIGSETQATLTEGEKTKLLITDKERWWNIVYEVVSNGFFALWLARIWFIRNRYFLFIEQK